MNGGYVSTGRLPTPETVQALVEEADGRIALGEGQPEQTYGVVDEIAKRALLTGARVLGVRAQDLPGGAPLAATLRYTL